MEGLSLAWLWGGLALGLALTIGIGWQFRRYSLASPVTPQGILDLELAGNWQQAGSMLNGLAAVHKLVVVRPNLQLDMVWIPCYVLTMTCACSLAATQLAGRFGWLAGLVVAAQPLAGALDYIENLALLRVLGEYERAGAAGINPISPKVAAICAHYKLRLLTAGLVLVIIGLLAWALA